MYMYYILMSNKPLCIIHTLLKELNATNEEILFLNEAETSKLSPRLTLESPLRYQAGRHPTPP
jgi:hypothetical protein